MKDGEKLVKYKSESSDERCKKRKEKIVTLTSKAVGG